MNPIIRLKLSAMMFLQFFIWGSWVVIMATYLGQTLQFDGSVIGRAYSTTALGAIFAPFFIGMIADRFFPGQVVLGVLHLIGGFMLFAVSRITDPGLFFWVLLGYALCYMPTLALVNSISFVHMSDPGKQFPGIRVLGTIGWIAAGLLLALINRIWGGEAFNVEATAIPFQIAGGASILLGLYSFTLPHTPPRAASRRPSVSEVLGLETIGLMRQPPFAVFVAASFLLCIPLSFYYNFTHLFMTEAGVSDVAGKMTFGQMSEIFFMLLMPLFFVRLGIKWMMIVGMGAWVARYALFATGDSGSLVWMLYAGILLHGVCFDFFFVTGQIYVDRKASRHLRSSAQGFIALITYGAGMFVGAHLSGWVVALYAIEENGITVNHDWQTIWLIPAAMALVVMLAFGLLFRDKVAPADELPAGAPATAPATPAKK